ncbi:MULTISPECIES: GntR family transcriptional regulator [Streptomyces]|uniref:GntR family transcriptional regulator n=1 Tax=Streptomyces evansiae TaxID=3075535 RepID=A0ABU2R0N2_9ACTN|nr:MULTISPECIES: GntR family transcriptional regulator [unclassified Streptomyces]MDT0409863.1 GntR family transcriptional regulator [Streptomyces sp. DSM 41979]MYQ60077.1 GntR family transcriptional regulator [Streptomyces sp. SID4926]SCD98324.1 DNA-binding transcriptional regulator, GntR family [Streptomyces sp. DfronAA-171]
MPPRDHTGRGRAVPQKYLVIAARIAADIRQGRYQAGELLPSEAQMREMYDVGQSTVRRALAELRTMGLVRPHQGKGTVVLAGGGDLPSTPVDRSVRRSGRRWRMTDLPAAEPPTVSRTTLEGIPALLLGQPDHDAISVDRIVYHPDSGARMAHRVLIPMSTVADVPALQEQPDQDISHLLGLLSDAGLALSITEHVSTRIPYPDERAALHLSDAAPLLITHRLTTSDDRPLLVEEFTAPGDTCQLVYSIAASKGSARPRE